MCKCKFWKMCLHRGVHIWPQWRDTLSSYKFTAMLFRFKLRRVTLWMLHTWRWQGTSFIFSKKNNPRDAVFHEDVVNLTDVNENGQYYAGGSFFPFLRLSTFSMVERHAMQMLLFPIASGRSRMELLLKSSHIHYNASSTSFVYTICSCTVS